PHASPITSPPLKKCIVASPIVPKSRMVTPASKCRRTMTKAEIRQRIWKTIEREAVGRFPFGSGRIPNFPGAEQAAKLLREMAVWRRALVVKVNPDAPQLPVPRLALQGGNVVYIAV